MEALIGTAFIGGLLMFLAPCTLPLVPGFLASLVPHSQKDLQPNEIFNRAIFIPSLNFILGFMFVFVLFGILAGMLGSTLLHYKMILAQVGGVAIIIFGLSLLRVLDIHMLKQSFSFMHGQSSTRPHRTIPVILGILFALGWAPCAGPILASILILTSQSSTAFEGGFLLFIFSLGLAIPFLLIGFLYGYFAVYLRIYNRYERIINLVSGFLLIILGIVLAFGQYIVLTRLGFSIYTFFGYTPMCTFL